MNLNCQQDFKCSLVDFEVEEFPHSFIDVSPIALIEEPTLPPQKKVKKGKKKTDASTKKTCVPPQTPVDKSSSTPGGFNVYKYTLHA